MGSHFLIVTIGTAGDVLPLITIGAHLQSQKYRVTMVASPEFESLSAANGLTFETLCERPAYEESLRDRHLLGTRYFGLFMRRHANAWNATIYDSILKYASRDLVVLGADRPHFWADLVACRERRIPAIRFQTDLPMLPEHRTSRIPDGSVQRNLATRWQLDWERMLVQRRRTPGPAQVGRILRSSRRMAPTVALWPEWIAPKAETRHVSRYFGFVPPPHIEAPEEVPFRSYGRKLIVFVVGTEGTTRPWIRQFVDTSAGICARLNCDGLLLGGTLPEVVSCRSEGLIWRKFVPLESILPYTSAIVHHGGIGTAMAAVLHKTPQLILPRLAMQPMNAEWLRRAGVCEVLEPRGYTVRQGAERVERLLTDEIYRKKARELATRSNFGADLRRVGEILEALAMSSPMKRV